MGQVGLLTFLALSAVVIVTPGPDTALTVRNTFLGGRRAGIFTAFGVSAGQIVWSVATSVGLVAVVLASEPIFRALKLLGAAYLVYLGGQSMLAAIRGSRGGDAEPACSTRAPLGGIKAFRQGVVNNLANPKMALFFASVFPQFAPAGSGALPVLLLLGLVFSGLTLSWLTLYAVVTARAHQVVRGSRLGRAIDGTCGITLLGLGVKVAMERR